MKQFIKIAILTSALTISSCHTAKKGKHAGQIESTTEILAQHQEVYQTDNLVILKLSDGVYQHISYLNTTDFGKVPCNGMIAVNENEVVIFDTPTDSASTTELISFVTKTLNCKIKAVIPTHFHEDCVGGVEFFNRLNIDVYASNQTINLLNATNRTFSKPMNGFDDYLEISIGNAKIYTVYYGEGHTSDNVIGYFPHRNAIFGGCLIKEMNAGKGYLGDANLSEWSKTVAMLKDKYPNATIVIPGHGVAGGVELLDYTIKLFQ